MKKTPEKPAKQDPQSSEVQAAKLFTNGRSQAVRLPKEFRFEGDEVYIHKIVCEIRKVKQPSLGKGF